MLALDTTSDDVLVGLGPEAEIQHERWANFTGRTTGRSVIAVLLGVQLVWICALLYAAYVFISA
jgi:hypothetical protein